MPDDEVRARVFISCGQREYAGEVDVARQVAERLREMGFDPYIAVQEQTLLGIRENIFSRLENSEYFIFIDFAREQLDDGERRGSLFSHQELAIASYLDIPVIAFQEKGVRARDGLIGFLQANITAFSDRHLLASIVGDNVRQRQWDPCWRGALRLTRDSTEYTEAIRREVSPYDQTKVSFNEARFFHVCVENLHRSEPCVGCSVHLERLVDLRTGEDIPVQPVEFKWRGFTLPQAHISPGRDRQFDAVWVFKHEPDYARFNLFSDTSGNLPNVPRAGDVKLHFAVLSHNMPPARGAFTLHLDRDLDAVTLE